MPFHIVPPHGGMTDGVYQKNCIGEDKTFPPKDIRIEGESLV